MAEPSKQEQDLFKRVEDRVNKEPIRELLVEFQQQFPGEIHTSGSKTEIVENLRNAVTAGRIPRNRVFGLLQEWEENGSQILLYYSPKTPAVGQLCRNPERVATQLFGSNWRQTQGFPKLTRLTSGYDVVDFRTGYMGKPNDWVMKVYTFQETQVRVRELEQVEVAMRGLIGLQQDEFAIIYRRLVTESVCLARWNDHPTQGLLEIRVELSGRLSRFEMDVNAIWARLRPAFDRDEDFDLWELRGALEEMLRGCSTHAAIYELGLANLIDSGEWGVRFTPYTENERIHDIPGRLDSIHQMLADGSRCDRLVMTWLAEGSGGVLEKDLRTYAGSRGANELVIRAQTTGQAVDYVTNQLRHFAS